MADKSHGKRREATQKRRKPKVLGKPYLGSGQHPKERESRSFWIKAQEGEKKDPTKLHGSFGATDSSLYFISKWSENKFNQHRYSLVKLCETTFTRTLKPSHAWCWIGKKKKSLKGI